MRPGKIAADEPPGSGLWILDFALEVWSGGGSFAGKPRWEDALVEAMKVQKWGNSGTGIGGGLGAQLGTETFRIKTGRNLG